MTDAEKRELIEELRDYATALRASIHVHHRGADLIEKGADALEESLTGSETGDGEGAAKYAEGRLVTEEGGHMFGELDRETMREAIANLIPLDLIHDKGREGQPQDVFEVADRILAALADMRAGIEIEKWEYGVSLNGARPAATHDLKAAILFKDEYLRHESPDNVRLLRRTPGLTANPGPWEVVPDV
ncbi:hypothetical protein MUN76_15265 [Leucobacter rhizosphaerae]|uniref:Uncharacterized protein n=1 Tax=Leucobacter rhizosphaerae TaxID=2932245 RepID=A0ABY4FVT4_9MICO|nr:hypothetical protein [Leucobacter rhizosphaerae]UOQ60368.1 hypothetical protein MUN76_15265 [Leucobacter rhizosphaerae]